ncbi:Scd6-like Sm domain-containing protein [Myxozyma melibiosi]|uniref:Scd6-like Sm domain-containing protein n=1 Tax=Myxozyma melibiosi TaxID=54550 RepID=A0ABR1F1A7_9ASCO
MSQYIGSSISLFSNSDIRYVGILHEINSDESTLTLKNVRSKGTEGRRGNPAEEIPPSDHLYEFICFRGSEVKDLVIEDEETPAPAPAAPAAAPQTTASIPDPTMLPNIPPGFQPPPGYQQFMPPYGYPQQPYMPYPPQFNPAMGMPPLDMSQPPMPMGGPFQPARQPVGPPATQSQQPPAQSPAAAPAAAAAPGSAAPGGKVQVVPAVPVPKAPKKPAAPANAAEGLAQQLSQTALDDRAPAETAKETVESTAAPAASQPPRPAPSGYAAAVAQNIPTGPRAAVNKPGPRYPRANGSVVAPRGPEVPASDFDFQENNAKFQKEAIAKEVSVEDEAEETAGGSENGAPEQFYNKASSFFDNISSATKATDSVDGRMVRQEERKLNLETFGQASIDNGRFRGRGRGRGRGFGYGRGRGGYGRGGYNRQPQQQQQA